MRSFMDLPDQQAYELPDGQQVTVDRTYFTDGLPTLAFDAVNQDRVQTHEEIQAAVAGTDVFEAAA